MPKYRVTCQCLYWFSDTYEVEANSKDDIDEDLLLSEGECVDSMIDSLDQINEITSIEKIGEEEDED